MQGKPQPATPDLASLLARAQEAARQALPVLESTLAAHLPGRIALYEDLLARIAQLDRDAVAPAGHASVAITSRGAIAQA